MARQIAEFGGGVTFDPKDAQGFQAAVSVAISELDLLWSEARSARDRWLQLHGAPQFLAIVEEALSARRGCGQIFDVATKGRAA
jgi:hypothetical protein